MESNQTLSFLFQDSEKSEGLYEKELNLEPLILYLCRLYDCFAIFIQEIFDIIQDIQKQGTTVLLIEQNANKALAIADRGYVLETGKIVLSGTGKELAASDEVRKAYLGG